MIFQKTVLSILAVCFGLANSFSQSGWAKEKGEIYAQASFSTFNSTDYFSVDGISFDGVNEFRQQSVNLYAEFGITDRLTGMLNSSALRLNSFSTTDVVAAPGDLQLGLKYALSKKIPVSISIAPEIPLGKADNFATAKEPNSLGIREQINLATTDGELNVWTTLAASTSLPNGKGWVTAFGAWNKRTKGFSDQLQTGLEVGFKPVEKFYLKARSTTFTSFGEAEPSVPFFRGEGTEMFAASLGAGWQIGKNLGVSLDYWRNIDLLITPKNAYVAPVFTLGIFYKKQGRTG